MRAFQTEDIGKLVLRLTLGILLLLHGVAKILGGVGGIAGMLQNIGLPGFLAYGVYIGEVLAPLAVIAGFYARVGAWLIAVNMLFAFGLVHAGDLVAMAGSGGGLKLEAQYMFFFTAIALALLGPGRYAFNQR